MRAEQRDTTGPFGLREEVGERLPPAMLASATACRTAHHRVDERSYSRRASRADASRIDADRDDRRDDRRRSCAGHHCRTSVRQQRLYADVADRAALNGQLRQASALLPLELRGASSGGGDIREARDTAIELRSSIATAVACTRSAVRSSLRRPSSGPTPFAGYLTAIAPSDTAWLLVRGDTADAWTPYAVSSASSVASGACDPLGPRLSGRRSGQQPCCDSAHRVVVARSAGSVRRVTRPVRYSLYRGGDGRWYLGQRDWNVTSLRLQHDSARERPVRIGGVAWVGLSVCGQHRRRAADSSQRSPSDCVDSRRRAWTVAERHAGVCGQAQGKSTDSVHLAVWLRNRR